MKIRVYYEDVDIGGVVYHSKYLNFCERARSEIFFAKGSSPIINDYHFVVKSIKANFLTPAFFGDLLEVKTKLTKIQGARVFLYQEVQKEGKSLFVMDIELVCLKGSRPARIPQLFVELLESQSALYDKDKKDIQSDGQ